MMLPDFIRRRARLIALVINGLLCLGITLSGLIYYNSKPHPSHHASLGSVAINLPQLDYRLTFEDLQSAGMFTELECKQCDFSRSRTEPHLRVEDFGDTGFMGTLYLGRGRDELWLHFYGEDIPAGQQRLEQALQALRARFPGREQAIQQVAWGFNDERPVVADPFGAARAVSRSD